MSGKILHHNGHTVNICESVVYSRRGKTYTARLNGEVVEQAATRENCELALIDIVAPVLGSRIRYVARQAGEASGRRCQRGAKLALRGAVQQNGQGWLVESETQEGVTYHVSYDRGWWCECQDWANGWHGEKWGAPYVRGNGHMCKHAWATKLVACDGKREQREQHDRPLEGVA